MSEDASTTSAASLPTGTITFLLTDIEGSTAMWERHPEEMEIALVRHNELIARAVRSQGGTLVRERGEGDSTFSVFTNAASALAAAVESQLALVLEPWPPGIRMRVRMALHTGEARLLEDDYTAPVVNRTARLRSVAHGEQILLSGETAILVADDPPNSVTLKDLGLHRLRDLSRPLRIFQVSHPDLPMDFPGPASLDTRPHNLPVQLTSFVGREEEVSELCRTLGEARLVTLTGAGGLGKTRLALQVAAELLEENAGGVWLVELAALNHPDLVASATAKVLGVREEPETGLLDSIAARLAGENTLLVLDNCEHLLDACSRLAAHLLTNASRLQILATSREPLGVAGETIRRVMPLPLPAAADSEELTHNESVRLFFERATLVRPDLQPTSQNLNAAAEIVRRLEGIPLAIELAAARAAVLAPEEIASRLGDRFRLLVHGDKQLARHQTLEAAVAWSHDLLDDAERTLFRRLSIFPGGATLEAAERVCSGDGLVATEVLDLLSRLVDKSLVLPDEHDGSSRFGMLETIREYAHANLVASGEHDTQASKLLLWLADLAQTAGSKLEGPEEAAWLDRLEAEHDNFRQALAEGLARSDPVALRMSCGALARLWLVRGHWSEGRASIERALAAAAGAADDLRAELLVAAGRLAEAQADYASARSAYTESLELRRELGEPSAESAALRSLGNVLHQQGDWADATRLYEESLAIARQHGDSHAVAAALNNLGIAALSRGDLHVAASLYEEGTALQRELGNRRGLASSVFNLGTVRRALGDDATARDLFEEALRASRELGDKRLRAAALSELGSVAESSRHVERARQLYQESLALQEELGDRFGIGSSLYALAELTLSEGGAGQAITLYEQALSVLEEAGALQATAAAFLGLGHAARAAGDPRRAIEATTRSLFISRDLGYPDGVVGGLNALAALAREDGDPVRAARLFAAAEAARRRMGVPAHASIRQRLADDITSARSQVGAEEWERAWEEGSRMELEDLLGSAAPNPPARRAPQR